MGGHSGWFHRDISGTDAEKLLKHRGVHGSFLARPSKQVPGDFSLSVRVNEQVTHIRIQNTGDYYDLYGGEKFATLSELVQFYTEQMNTLQDRDGTVIELKYPLNCSDPTNERWYHGHLAGSKAEALLAERGAPGTFLVRESLSKPGDFVLSVLTGEEREGERGGQRVPRVTHIKILCQDNKFTVGGSQKFENLSDLVEFYKKSPIEEITGKKVQLLQPFYATRVNAADIENRVQELSKKKEMEEKSTGKADPIKGGFWEEFDALQKQEDKLERSEGKKPENKGKNRYKNILPFDCTRVVLNTTPDSPPCADYINANYIEATLGSGKRYIATQGCLAATVNHFWQMVWQEMSTVVVMTTMEVEKGRNKCVPYWPEVDSSQTYGRYEVTNTGIHEAVDYRIRSLRVQPSDGSATPRMIKHYHYQSWPDHGVPAEPGGVLSFLTEVNKEQERVPEAGPIIVHCSAGIGRTGTIIVIDMLVDKIDSQGVDCDIDIQRTIQEVRSQRSGMVQTEAQYKFIYLSVLQYIEITKQKIDLLELKPGAESEYGNIKYPPHEKKQHRGSRKSGNEDKKVYENVKKEEKEKSKMKLGSMKKK
uniref:Tyrosine-protein phosphatase non-receptor type n=1 Tax=Callorhinchus milii TaxID=7868 RepID=V9KLN5_CALMI